MNNRRVAVRLSFALLSSAMVMAQTSINLNVSGPANGGGPFTSNTLVLGQTGSVGSLGNAALLMTSNSAPIGDNGIQGPVQVGFELAFNEVDTIAISFSESDPNFAMATTVAMSGGTITGGTGAYAGATGSLDLTITKDSAGAFWSTSTTSGSGTLTAGGSTTPLKLTNFRGWCCGWATREEDYYTSPVSVSGSLGQGTGTLNEYYYSNAPNGTPIVNGVVTVNFNSADSVTLLYKFNPPSSASILDPPQTFGGGLAGGTGAYANATGSINVTATANGYTVTGTMTTNPGPQITKVKTIFGLPQMSFNTWMEIHGQNLVPADTPASGVDWSKAPDFAKGQMPTQLGPVGVAFGAGGGLGYVYFYCSARTNPNCADDQINVLAPLLNINDPGAMLLSVLNNGAPIATTWAFREHESPAFLSFDTKGHIAARHLDSSLMAPASLYPGASTPAKAGEIISLYGTGFGPAGNLVEGSATQSGNLSTGGLSCWVTGVNAPAVGALVSPGLYQINLTVPKNVPSGDNPVVCMYNFYPTAAGALIAVQ